MKKIVIFSLFSIRVCGFQHTRLEVDRQTSRVIAPGQVVHGGLLDALLVDPLELLDRHHLALVADRVHGVLVSVRRLEQPALEIKDFSLNQLKVFVCLLQG